MLQELFKQITGNSGASGRNATDTLKGLGDGIGKETIPEGLKALYAVAERMGTFQLAVEQFPWGCEHYLETGEKHIIGK
ncbi:MAG: hypothetical protein P8Z31_10315, partial [Gammaproteobacteria bacterium]